jgi:Ca2+-binding EF-hand superfamily protein
LFQDDSQEATIKITYAGVANLPSSTKIGYNNQFIIPEWNPPGKDIYSVGMIAYKLLSGGKEPPTDMDTQRVVPGTNLFLGRRWKLISISKNAKNFIEQCLHSWDMKPQFTVEDALQHIWMTQEHVHRSDTSRPTDTIDEVTLVKWNNVGSSLTVSEHVSLQHPTIPVPVVSLTAEQYAREVSSKMTDVTDTQLDTHDAINNSTGDDIPVFVSGNTDNVVVDEDVTSETVDAGDNINDDIGETDLISNEESIPVESDDAVNELRVVAPPENPIPDERDDQSNDHVALAQVEKELINTDETPSLEPEYSPLTPPETLLDYHSDEKVTHLHPDQEGSVAEDETKNRLDNTLNVEPVPSPLTSPTTTEDLSETDTPEEFNALRDAFQEVTSASENDVVTMDTLKERLRTRYTEEEVNSWFQGHENYEDSKSLNYKAFLNRVIQNRRSIDIQRVDAAFKRIDKGKHGYVTVGNLRAVLGKDNNENIEQLIKAANTNRDGTITYENFERVVQILHTSEQDTI